MELRLRLPAAEKAPMPKELLDHAGYYGSLTVYQVELSEDGTLTMRYPATPDFPPRTFYYYSDGTFRDGGGTSALRLVAVEGGRVIAAAWSGKIKTAATMVCICLMLLPISEPLNRLCWAAILLTTVYSGVEYFLKNKDVIDWTDM